MTFLRLGYVGVRLFFGGVLQLVDRDALPVFLKPFGSNGLPSGKHCQKVARTLEALGPFYIKFGQFLSTRPDIVGVQFANTLAYFQDNLPAFAPQIAEQHISKSLGAVHAGLCASDLFDTLPPAVAAASVAQVHRVRLKSTGQDVAVKVLRPGIRALFQRDLKAVRFGAKLGLIFIPKLRRLRPLEVVNTFQEWTDQELDLTFEAASSERLVQSLSGMRGYRVPQVVWEYVTRDVMVTEWVEGDKITDLDVLDRRHLDRASLAKTLMEAFLRQALFDGFFHGDVHGGNFLVDGQGDIVALDFGIMGHISFKERRFLAEVLWCFINRDYDRVAALHYDIGYVPYNKQPHLFSLALRAVGEPIFNKPSSDISMAAVLQKLFSVTEQFGMQTVPELLLLQKTMVMVEGLCRQIDPQFHMWNTAEPIVNAWVQQNFGARGAVRQLRALSHLIREDASDLPALYRRVRGLVTSLESGSSSGNTPQSRWGGDMFWRVLLGGFLSGLLGTAAVLTGVFLI